MALPYIDLVPAGIRNSFDARVRAIAKKYGFDPGWLMIVMRFETGGQFLPGYYKTSNAVGLIQFTTVGAAQVKSDKDTLSKMSVLQQLDYVDKYYASFNVAGKIKSLNDCYLVVFAPAFVGKPESSKVYIKGTLAYTGNAALDIGKKGYITVGDIGNVIHRYLPAGYPDTLGPLSVLGSLNPTQAGSGNMGTILLGLIAGGLYLKNRSKKRE